MAVVQDHEARGGCPRCQHLFPEDILENAFGHLSDGVLYLACPNCRQELTVEVKFVWSEVLS
ncbi:hypothetical protein [Deinococcus marmoris]|uniref:Uncharacterized protein n=1 Tax=Deinococcus marmoris TaxID=249408 RepID=A0A1U7P4R6_9DEIO|nr:hypothetical protein [Deinococcus marmoris]OLV20164.1 hypothetical protein BOO71_0000520 [Deinococcus marmoris]